MFVPLSHGEDGVAFEIPEPGDSDTSPAAWLVLKKAPARGRPAVVHRRGKPMTVPLDANHQDLFAEAGQGRYRLQLVDRYGRKVDGIPVAHTGLLTAYPVGEEDELAGDPDMTEELDGMSAGLGSMSARRSSGLEAILIHTVSQNTSALQQMIGQFVPVMQACTQLLQMAASTAVTSVAQDPAAESLHESASQVGSEPSIIKQVIDSVMPYLMAQFGAGAMMGSFSPAATAGPPPALPAAPYVPQASAHATPPGPSTRSPSVPPAPPSAGTPPSAPSGTAPAESWAETQARIGLHLQQVLGALTPQEQAHAAMLIGRLPEPTREALLKELLSLSVPEAIERARAILRGQSEPAPAPGAITTPAGPVPPGGV